MPQELRGPPSPDPKLSSNDKEVRGSFKKGKKGGKKEKEGKKPRKNRENGDNSDLRVAFVADWGLGKNPAKVMNLVDDWGAELVVSAGDFDYVDSPDAFMDMMDTEVGKDFPFIGSVGNHDILEWYGRGGYRDRLLEKLGRIKDISCYGEYGANMVFVMSGVGSLGQNHAQFIDLSMQNYKSVPWKVCFWHKNQKAYQTGDKENETGYEVYETCRKHGAIIATAHEHSYERTHLMSHFESQSIASTNNTLNIKPGETFAFVSGLGGESMRKWVKKANKNPWWASTVSKDNKGEYGALLCKFNKGGDPNLARCKFKDVKGKKWDDFWVHSDPDGVSETYAVFDRKPDVELVEVGVEGVEGIVSVDRVHGGVTCGGSVLGLSNSSVSSYIHALRYQIPATVFDPVKGDVLRSARLQVMGAHSGRGFLGLVETRIALGVRLLDSDWKCRCVVDGYSTEQGAFRIDMSDNFVEWSYEDEGWEAGEVWNSPDISAIVSAGMDSLGRVALLMDGSSSLDSEVRSVYGVHGRWGFASVPH
ncbi:Metallo-dependent phosphatase [Rhizoclosmatium globosum]|uniref:Metallo-dependent phosphatase n=1 Tax=Rhizoclosmatium globosum TaxID=329046 RepID=A0A1Y2CVQ8_9FUNG|nr:Metallo-dependent phosphatase [Rhizoclosmatium globosum]|eukprot:ORY51108.1 Metallo-dependent phosphatase [Rhizoclosmatium globosum]